MFYAHQRTLALACLLLTLIGFAASWSWIGSIFTILAAIGCVLFVLRLMIHERVL